MRRHRHRWGFRFADRHATAEVPVIPAALNLTPPIRTDIDHMEDSFMNKDRIAGAAKQASGVIKELTGKIVGDADLTARGTKDKVKGMVQSAVGRGRDAVK